MRSSMRAALLGALLLPAAAAAQGTLSTQGYGYPGGQISTRSLGAGGATAESDPFSATNPAAIYNFGASLLYFQAEPEYRRLSRDGATEKSTIARYPLMTAGVPLGSNYFVGLTVSNLLDRSFTNVVRATQTLRGEVVPSTNTFTSDGAIADVRLALAWAPRPWLHVGLGGHAITGDNELVNSQVFDDTLRYAALVDSQTVTFSGAAYSAGVDLLAGRIATVSASYRRGGALSAKRADTTLRNARVPDRMAIGVAFVGIRGTTLGIRTARDRWSRMASLALPTQPVTDSWDTSIGADVLGPRMFGVPLQLRAGARTRTLPFGIPASTTAAASNVSERSVSLGAGGLLARSRASFDFAVVRSFREAASSSLKENAWTMSFGISVRP